MRQRISLCLIFFRRSYLKRIYITKEVLNFYHAIYNAHVITNPFITMKTKTKETNLSFLMKGANFLIPIFLLFTTVSSLAKASKPTSNTQQTCSYSIQIETTCAPSAETTDHISVRFKDAAGNLIIVKELKNPKLVYAPKNGLSYKNGFQKCGIAMFEAKGPCMKQKVCALFLKRVGSDEWRPGWVKVLHQEKGGRAVQVSYKFYFRTFVPGNVWYGFDYCNPRGDGYIPHLRTFGGEK